MNSRRVYTNLVVGLRGSLSEYLRFSERLISNYPIHSDEEYGKGYRERSKEVKRKKDMYICMIYLY